MFGPKPTVPVLAGFEKTPAATAVTRFLKDIRQLAEHLANLATVRCKPPRVKSEGMCNAFGSREVKTFFAFMKQAVLRDLLDTRGRQFVTHRSSLPLSMNAFCTTVVQKVFYIMAKIC